MKADLADPNIFDYPDRMAPLHIACGPDGSLEIAQVILSCPNTNPNVLDGKQQAPIHYAVSNAQPNYYSASNANPNIRNSFGLTALHIACNQACIKPRNSATFLEITGILQSQSRIQNMELHFKLP